MSERPSDQPNPQRPDDSRNWAPLIHRLKVVDAPQGAKNLNMNDRRLSGPLQGFGQLWQKRFKARLDGARATPAEVIELWKAKFPELQPPDSRFYPSLEGVKPGEMMWIEATVPPAPGFPSMLPVATGVLVLYADETSFTVVSPEGHPVSGWNTFSAYEEDGHLYAEVNNQVRTSDPIYEFAYRFLGSQEQQDGIWVHVLMGLARQFGVETEVSVHKELLDPKIQWRNIGNIRYNAALRTMAYTVTGPVRWLGQLGKR